MAEQLVIRPKLVSTLKVKPLINIGALCDIPTGHVIKGVHGESIINGGLGFLTGLTGIGNQFKSTIMHYMMLSAAARIGQTSYCSTYDTEINVQEDRFEQLCDAIRDFNGYNLIREGMWEIADKVGQLGGEWFDNIKEYMQEKIRMAKKIGIELPFIGRDGKLMTVPAFSFLEVDSLSEFVTENVVSMQEAARLGDSKGNMVSMAQGMQKNRFLMEIPTLSAGSFTYALMTAHLGDDFVLDPYAPPKKKLAYLPQGQKLKGVPEKFTFIMNNCWWASNATPLRNKTTKAPEYPRNSNDDLTGDTDLCEVTIRQLRGKSGPTGMAIVLVISQSEGVLPSLTEFHFIKENGRFGLMGDNTNYVHEMCPDIKLSRTRIRGKIDEHKELRRALNISAEMLQMFTLWRKLPLEYVCTPGELKKDLEEIGYDFDYILKNTRGWWAPTGVHKELKFLSTMDLLRMRTGEYVPYWLPKTEKDKLDLSKAKQKPRHTFEMTEEDIVTVKDIDPNA